MSDIEKYRWAEGWPTRVPQVVREIGYRDLTEFLAAMPSMPYSAVVVALGNLFAPAQIVSVQFEEARQTGRIRCSAKDSLCRHIVEKFPEGWNEGENLEYRRVSALVDWSTEMEITGGLGHLEKQLDNFRQGFTAPKGWIPSGPDDPVVEQAFDKFWPEEGGS